MSKKRKADQSDLPPSKQLVTNQEPNSASSDPDIEHQATDPFFNLLHSAAFAGNVSEIKLILDKSVHAINYQTSIGLTPLMLAALGGHLEAVDYLLEIGADPFIIDFSEQGMSAKNYANCQQIRQSILDKQTSLLHEPAMIGDLDTIKKTIANTKIDVNCLDSNGKTALLWAAICGHLDIVKFLIEQGADLSLVDGTRDDILSQLNYLRNDKEIEKVYKYLKEQYKEQGLGFKSDKKKKIVANIKSFFKELFSKMKGDNKVLIMLGEIHDAFSIYQVKKVIFKLLSKYGIRTIYVECPNDGWVCDPSQLKLSKKLGIEYHPIDNARSKEKQASLAQRDQVMCQEIENIGKSGVVVVGNNHLKGMCERLSKLQGYTVIPINLSPLNSKEPLERSDLTLFAYNSSKVVQVTQEGISKNPQAVIARWNKR